jgi:hypothetical protein
MVPVTAEEEPGMTTPPRVAIVPAELGAGSVSGQVIHVAGGPRA